MVLNLKFTTCGKRNLHTVVWEELVMTKIEGNVVKAHWNVVNSYLVLKTSPQNESKPPQPLIIVFVALLSLATNGTLQIKTTPCVILNDQVSNNLND
jgi:hypothetical protein